MDAEDVLALVQQPAADGRRQVADKQVLLDRVAEVVVKAGHVEVDVDQLDEDGEREAEEEVAHHAPTSVPALVNWCCDPKWFKITKSKQIRELREKSKKNIK